VSSPPLDGVRVLSVGHTLPGLYCIGILRDLGADVTRVERVTRAADRFPGITGAFPVRSLDAGTARCGVDLKSERGRALYRRLAACADVVLEGFRPGTATRLDIGPETLARVNPRLIYVAVSGFGQEGPARDRVGHDLGYLAATGALAGVDRPPGPTYADGLAGMSAAVNVLAALRARDADGRGRVLDVAIVDGPAFLMSMEYEAHWQSPAAGGPRATHLTGAFPWYQVFETADGKALAVSAVEPHFYASFCRLIGLPELAERQTVPEAERPALMARVRAALRSRTRAEWLALAAGTDACVEAVLTPGEAADAPQLARARRAAPGERTPLVRSPVRLEPAPLPAERGTRATLAAYGITDDEIASLSEEGVIDP
jgi:alpha-methylacyl-CoA racemase